VRHLQPQKKSGKDAAKAMPCLPNYVVLQLLIIPGILPFIAEHRQLGAEMGYLE
jgi:hypothetical protein